MIETPVPELSQRNMLLVGLALVDSPCIYIVCVCITSLQQAFSESCHCCCCCC